MRNGSELVRASSEYAVEDRARTWNLLAFTVLIQALAITATLMAPWWPVKLAGSVFIGLTVVRLFIFYHDYLHGALLKDSSAGHAAMWLVGLYTMAPVTVWKQTHNYHHQNNAKMLGSAIGSYPVVTVGMWKGMSPKQKLGYAAIRNPFTILMGHYTLFVIGMCLSPFRRDPRTHWQAPVVLFLWWGIFACIGLTAGWVQALFVMLLPGMISSATGAYLFYAQHNFPGAEFRDRRHWSYVHAALKCSSMFEMGPLMHWFTGNIGYHHVHHLNHKIPFYRLPEAMAGMPELQDCHTTSWRPTDVWACLRLALWDPEAGKMISFLEARDVLARQAA